MSTEPMRSEPTTRFWAADSDAVDAAPGPMTRARKAFVGDISLVHGMPAAEAVLYKVADDVYAGLVRPRQSLTAAQQVAWQRWVSGLPWAHREHSLFELETLLRGLACLGNPRNHPGNVHAELAAHGDHSGHVSMLRDIVQQSLELTRRLLGRRDRTYSFSRFLESATPFDSERTRITESQVDQANPAASLLALRHGLTHILELLRALLQLNFVSQRQYEAVRALLARELARSVYFRPTLVLEFRPDCDRIPVPQLLEVLAEEPKGARHRHLALVFLASLRSLRYLELVEDFSRHQNDVRLSLAALAAIRAELRALASHLEHQAPDVLAEDFTERMLGLSATEVETHFTRHLRHAASLVSFRGTLEAAARALNLEVRRTFQSLPGIEAFESSASTQEALTRAAKELRASIGNAVTTVMQDVAPNKTAPDLDATADARRAQSERLRREVWMFSQVLRAFIAKLEAGNEGNDTWDNPESFRHARDFLTHFRSIGLQLVRNADYRRVGHFLAALEPLREAGQLSATEAARTLGECKAFYAYLNGLFDNISCRAELADVPFDRESAAEILRLHLGA